MDQFHSVELICDPMAQEKKKDKPSLLMCDKNVKALCHVMKCAMNGLSQVMFYVQVICMF